MDDDSQQSRRKFLALASSTSLLGLAGCLSYKDKPHPSERTKEFFSADMNRPLPEGREECVSIDGYERDPDSIAAKGDVQYQFHPHHGSGGVNDTEMCANCRFFCPAADGDRIGACARVAGGIRSQDWCALWQPTEELQQLRDERASGSE
jgi:hypothetical protein